MACIATVARDPALILLPFILLRYNEGLQEHVRSVSTEAQTKISDLKNMIMFMRETQGNLAKKESQAEYDAKRVWATRP